MEYCTLQENYWHKIESEGVSVLPENKEGDDFVKVVNE